MRSNTANGGHTYVDLVIQVVATAADSYTLRAVVYLTSLNVIDTNNTLNVGGNWSRGGALNLNGVYNATPVWFQDIVVGRAYGSNTGVSVNFSWSGVEYWATTLSASESYTVPARAWEPPAAPTIGTLTRNSDTSHTIAWTNHPTSSAPYNASTKIFRSTDGGGWANIASVPSAGTSYTDTTTSADHTYAYLVQAVNSQLQYANSASSATLQTTPKPPTSVSAVKTSSNNINISWVNASSLPGTWTFTIEESQNSGSSWAALVSGLAKTATTYTHTAPSTSVLHRYRVKAVSSAPVLSSAYTAMTTDIQLAAPPNAPTGLGPSTIRDASEDVTFHWTHNPVDSAPQSGFQLRHRVVGSGTWTTVTVTSTASTWVLPGGTYANPLTVEWQVATKGIDPGYGPWSASANAPSSTRPTAVISAPVDAGTWALSALTVAWTYYDAEDTPQASWEATLYDGAMVLEQLTAAGAASSATFATVLPEGADRRVTVRVRDGAGLWSLLDSASFTVAYALPPVPDVDAVWFPQTATVVVSVDVPDPDDVEVPAVHVEVYRSIDGGPEVLIATGVPVGSTITDYAPTVQGVNTYRAEAVSGLPSTATSDVVEVTTPAPGDGFASLWVSGGPGFSQVARAVSNTTIRTAAGLAERVLYEFAGRDLPVEITGTGRRRTWQITTDVFNRESFEGATAAQWLALGLLPGPLLLRALGIYAYVSISDVTTDRPPGRLVTQVGFALTEVDAS